MIKLTSQTSSGYISHLVAPSAIACITEASTSSQWHGIRAYVKLFDGKVIEVCETMDHIEAMIAKVVN